MTIIIKMVSQIILLSEQQVGHFH